VAAFPARSFASETLCQADETVYFSCQTKPSGRIVSLCGNNLKPQDQFWLQYRFGRPEKLELAYPTNRTLFVDTGFEVDYLRRANRFDTEVSFTNGPWSYTVFYNTPGESVESRSGVFVARDRSGPGTSLLCAKTSNELYGALSSLGRAYGKN
jgi:hypothetical protein